MFGAEATTSGGLNARTALGAFVASNLAGFSSGCLDGSTREEVHDVLLQLLGRWLSGLAALWIAVDEARYLGALLAVDTVEKVQSEFGSMIFN